MANTLQYETLLKNMAHAVAESFPLLRRAYAERENFDVPSKTGGSVIINRPNPNSFTPALVTPAAYGSGEASYVTIPETVTFGQPVAVNFAPTDLEVARGAWEGIMSPTMQMAARSIGKYVAGALADVAIVSAYQQVAKTADALADMANIMDAFADNGVGTGKMTLCLPGISEFTSNANLLHSAIGRGSISGGYGIDTVLGEVAYDHSLSGKSFTNGTGTAYQVGPTGSAKGATTVLADTGSGTIKVGDIVTFAGHTGKYVVTTALSGGTMEVYPPLRAAVADNEAITVTSTTATALGVAVHELGLAYVSRPILISPEAKGQTFFASGSDDQSGITLNYEVRREHFQERRLLSCLFQVAKGYPDALVKYDIS